MRRALILAAALAGISAGVAADDPNQPWVPQNGDTVYFSVPLRWNLGSSGTLYRNIPYRDLDCPATNVCFYTLPACQAVELGKQTERKTSLWTAGGRWVVKEDLRRLTHPTAAACAEHVPVRPDSREKN